MRMILSLLLLIFISACSQSNPPALQESPRIVEHIDIIQEDKNESLPPTTQKNYSSFYLSQKNFIYTAGVPIERIINILKPINPVYFDGVVEIKFIKTNKEVSKSKDGWYYSDSKSIEIFVDYESDEFLTRTVLSELKHHYCLTKERDSFNKCLNSKMKNEFDTEELWDYCYHDEGCFLDTPIDKEYEFIK